MKRLTLSIVLIFLVAGCVPVQATATPDPEQPVTSETPSPPAPANPYAPQPEDEKLARAMAFLNSADLLTLESFPVQIMLILRGSLPTPCHALRVIVHQPDDNNNIDVEIYSVADPDAICAQVLQSFEASIPLGSFPTGYYTLSVNGERVGDFNS
jgi:hypothetical protein